MGIDAGHRVTRHESKCQNVHGHRYEVEVTVAGDLDHAGRVVDFGVVKQLVGGWLDDALDHGYIAAPWDDMAQVIRSQGLKVYVMPDGMEPTAENLAALVAERAQELLNGVQSGLKVTMVRVYETPNCWADWNSSG